MKSVLKIYLFHVAGVAVLLSLPFLANLLFLYQADELRSLQEVARLQMSRPILYGPAFIASSWPYKLALAA